MWSRPSFACVYVGKLKLANCQEQFKSFKEICFLIMKIHLPNRKNAPHTCDLLSQLTGFQDGLMDDIATKNISNCIVSYTALRMKTDLYNQILVVQLQKYPNTFLLVFFVSPKIVQNVVALSHFFQHVPHFENTFKYINTYAFVFCVSV